MDSNTELKYQLVFDLNKRHEAHLETLDSLFKGTTNTQNDNDQDTKKEDLFPAFFQEKYKDVFDTLEYIVKRKKGEKEKKEEKKSDKFDDYIHNVILISGSRGSGKTSMLHSIGKHLETKNVSGQEFTCLPPIDPSYFDQNRNILKSVLSKMFKMAKNKFNGKSCYEADFTDLWKSFERVYKTLEYVDGAKKECYTLEALNESSDASDLRDQMQKLISSFLKAIGENDNILVLLIDDLDMNVSFAAEMMEQIRKFLMVDNLIILVSANLEQLQSEMREYYSKEFQNVVKNSDLNIDIDDLAAKYLLKMFPPKRRIELDDNKKNLLQTALILEDSSRKDSKERFKKYNGDNRNSLQKVLLTMLWDKTRLLFIPKKDQLHPLIPTTMRELFQFIAVLADMKEVEEPMNGNLFINQENYEKIKKNLAVFKSYFLNIWVSHHVSEDEKQLILNMPQDIEEVNKYLIQAINKVGNKYKEEKISKDHFSILKNDKENPVLSYTMVSNDDPHFSVANRISNISNEPSNVSYGDLTMIISKYETYFEDSRERNFIEAVKIRYTILLLETLFFSQDSINFNDSHITNIQKLIAGTLYHPSYFKLIHPIVSDKEIFTDLNEGDVPCNFPHFHHCLISGFQQDYPDILRFSQKSRNILAQFIYENTNFSIGMSKQWVENLHNAFSRHKKGLIISSKSEYPNIIKYLLELMDDDFLTDTYGTRFILNLDNFIKGKICIPKQTNKDIFITILKNISLPTIRDAILNIISDSIIKEISIKLSQKDARKIIMSISEKDLNDIFAVFSHSKDSYGDSTIARDNPTLFFQLDSGAIMRHILQRTDSSTVLLFFKQASEEIIFDIFNQLARLTLDDIIEELPPITLRKILQPSIDKLVEYAFQMFTHVIKTNDLFIQYFGAKRPDRYENLHIYDTNKRDIPLLTDFAWDILSPLMNILNIQHSTERFLKQKDEKETPDEKETLDEKETNPYKESTNLLSWEILHTFEEKNYHNSFLPIYSVDYLFNILNNEVTLGNSNNKLSIITSNAKIDIRDLTIRRSPKEKNETKFSSILYIQERDFPLHYYDKYLWNEITEDALSRISINDTIKNTYKKIFDAGMEVVFGKDKYEEYKQENTSSTSSNN